MGKRWGPAAPVNVVRSVVPAVTHVDYSARVQDSGPGADPRFYRLMQAFYQRTGCPVLVNTASRAGGADCLYAPGCLPLFPGDGNGRSVLEIASCTRRVSLGLEAPTVSSTSPSFS